MERVVARGQAAPGTAERGSAGRHHQRVRVHADDGGQQERPQGRRRKSRWSKRSQRPSRSRIRPRRWWRRKRSRPRARRRRRSPEAKPAEPEKKATEAKPDPIAEALAKDEAKKPEPKKAEAKPPTPPKKPAPPAPKFDPKKVEALLDKRDSTRLAAAGDTLNNAASLGVSSGKAAQISLSELDALRQRLAQLWTPPAGAKDPQELVVRVQDQASGPTVGWLPGRGRNWWRAAIPRSRSPPAKAPRARSTAASLSTCSSPNTTSNGKTSRSPSIRATCSVSDCRQRAETTKP